MIELKSSRKQENSTPWVGRTFGNILLLEGLPAVSTCCREPFAFHIGREHSKFIFFLALLDIFEQNFGRQKRRGGRCQSKPLIIPSLKLTMGLINTIGGEGLRIVQIIYFVLLIFSTFDQEKEEEETDFQTFM